MSGGCFGNCFVPSASSSATPTPAFSRVSTKHTPFKPPMSDLNAARKVPAELAANIEKGKQKEGDDDVHKNNPSPASYWTVSWFVLH